MFSNLIVSFPRNIEVTAIYMICITFVNNALVKKVHFILFN